MSDVTVNNILSAEYKFNGSILFKLDANIGDVHYEELLHNYKEGSLREIDKLCKVWLESNTPSDFAPYVPSAEELEVQVRDERNMLIESTMWVVQRHQSEVANTSVSTTSITEQKYQEWLTYHQELRDITDQSGFPTSVVWPTQPE
jgi:hypothetical protein